MKPFHGSDRIVPKPSIEHSRTNLDFGPGFYLTPYEEQAKDWARRKAMRSHGTPYLNIYDVTEIEVSRMLRFPEPDASWVEFVCACRKNDVHRSDYHVIVGTTADSKVYCAVDMYFRGYWDMETTLRALRYHCTSDQWCFTNQTGLDEHVSFVESYEVELLKPQVRIPLQTDSHIEETLNWSRT